MISRTAENTVGRLLRSSSATSPAGSGIVTLTSSGPAAAVGWPARASAAPSTGSSTAPRRFSARAVTTRPRATISAHGFT